MLSWKHEGDQHWQECANCDYATDKGAHVWTEKERQNADCVTNGWVKYECECGESKEQTLPAEGHHNFAELIETKTPATCGTAGRGVYKCTGCEATEEREIPATGKHALSWCREGDQHWQKCANCDYATDKEAHVWTETARKEATCSAEGHVDYSCETCSATKTETIDKTAHTYETKFNDTQHYHQCSVCQAIDGNSYENHAFGDWVIDREATFYLTGSRHKECTECDYKTSVENYELDGYVTDYRNGIVAGNTSGWEYGHSDYNWNAPTEGRLPGNTANNESFVFTKSTEFNGDAWLTRNENDDVISEIKAGWLNGSWSTLAYTVGKGVENASYTLALGYKYNPADSHKDLYTAANVRIAVLSQDRTCKYSEFIHLDGHGTNEAREISGLNTGDKIYVFIEFEEEKEKDGDNVTNISWSNGDFTCRIFEKQPEQTQDE